MRRAWLAIATVLLATSSPMRATPAEDAWAGRWAMELRLASVAKMPLLPSQRSTTISRMLVDLERGPKGWVQRHRVCDVRVERSSAVRMTVPRAFIEAIPERQYPVSFDGTPDRWSYVADLGVETMGLSAGFSGAELPRAADHPSVQDTDGDGAPGATVEMLVPVAGRARLFIVQRSHLVLSGRGTTGAGLHGTVEVRMQQQRTVGANPAMFGRSPAIRPDAARSRFTLVRAPHAATCKDLR